MRRPTFCHNSVAAVEVNQAPPSQSHHNIDKEETRLARMKRIFTGSLLMGRRPQAGGPPLKSFAVHLDELPLTNEGLPRVVVRITTFIEKYGLQMEGLFRLSGGNPKLVEQLKVSFDRTGDADLESCGDVTSVAALLKLWLRDLPEPPLPPETASQLLSILQKYKGDTDEWCLETGRVLACVGGSGGLRERNARLLRCLLRLLHRYQQQQQLQQPVQHLAPVFAALLMSLDDSLPRLASPDTVALTYALIANYRRIYNEDSMLACGEEEDDVKMEGGGTHFLAGKNKSLSNAHAPTSVMNETTPLSSAAAKKQRKRKDRQSSADRKFVRSNSEERPCKSSYGGGGSMGGVGGGVAMGGGGGARDSIRRVSSHEDFSRSHGPRHSAHLMELISETAASIQMSTPPVVSTLAVAARPLHERNQQQQQLVVRSAPPPTKNHNTLNNNNNNNNLNLNHNNKVKPSPSATPAGTASAVEYNNNNNSEALPWQEGECGVRRDESLAVSVVCTPPPSADCQLIAAVDEDESEHERRRSSERFAPCGPGYMAAMMGAHRRGGGGGGVGDSHHHHHHRRRRKMVSSQRSNGSSGGGGSRGSHRRHTRSPRGGSEDTDGGSSSKENEEESAVSGGHIDRRSTLMVVSPPPPRPLPPQASYSGEEEEEEASDETPGSLSRSTSESEEPPLLNAPPLTREEQDEKAEENEKSAQVEGDDEEEVKGDVEELEEDDEEEEEIEGVEEEEEEEKEQKDEEEPVLDLNRLHRSVDTVEPVPSRHDWSFAPPAPQSAQQLDSGSLRSSATFAAGHRAFEAAQAVSAVAAATPTDHLPISGSHAHITHIEHHHAKQIQTLKKRLKRYEEGFEREFGYKPSSADKMANPDTKKMCQTLSKLRRELKQLKSEALLCPSTSMSQLLFLASGDRVGVASATNGGVSATKVIKEDVVHDLEKRLQEKRQQARRPAVLEEMSREQLADEKTAVQRALLQLEAVYGRPGSREQRDLVRPLYDRYRCLKRLLARAVAAAKLKEGVAELGTIPEHEQMDFSSCSPPPPSVAAVGVANGGPSPSLGPASATVNGQRPTTPDFFENLHALPRNELMDQHKTTREEKKRLRRQLHEFEDELENKMGRKLQKEDRLPMDAVYTQYKHVKAKLRLIEALITKK